MKKNSVVVKLSSIILALCLTLEAVGCGKEGKEADSYSYSYTMDGYLYTMSLLYFEDAVYREEPFIEASAVSEGSPDWGIMVEFESEGEFLYFYQSHSPGGINLGVENADFVETIQISGGSKLEVKKSGDYVFGSYMKESYYGIIFYVENKNWEAYRDRIISLIETAEAVKQPMQRRTSENK